MLLDQETKEMEFDPEILRRWKGQLPPPPNNPCLNDRVFTIALGKREIQGEIVWESTLEQYAFQFVTIDSRGGHYPYRVQMTPTDLARLRGWLKKHTGITALLGINTKTNVSEPIKYGSLEGLFKPTTVGYEK